MPNPFAHKDSDDLAEKLRAHLRNVQKFLKGMNEQGVIWVGKHKSVYDRMTVLAGSMKQYSEIETSGLKSASSKISDHLLAVEKCRDAMIERVEAKVLAIWGKYDALCHHAKEILDTRERAVERYNAKKLNLEKLTASDARNVGKMTIAKSELALADTDVQQQNSHLQQHIQNFTKEKIDELRRAFSELLHAQILFHSKALEQVSQAFVAIDDIDDVADLQEVMGIVTAGTKSTTITVGSAGSVSSPPASTTLADAAPAADPSAAVSVTSSVVSQ